MIVARQLVSAVIVDFCLIFADNYDSSRANSQNCLLIAVIKVKPKKNEEGFIDSPASN